MKSRNRHILLVWDRMGDYHRARWKALAAALPERNVYAADLGGEDRLYEWKNTDKGERYFQLSPHLPGRFDWKRISRFMQIVSSHGIGTVCIAGYGRVEYLFFLLYGKLTGRQVILFAESWYPSAWPAELAKSFFLRFACDGFLVSGKRALDHFISRLRVAPSKVRIGYSVVDNQHFESRVKETLKKRKVLLCVARFAPEKNLGLLIEAFQRSRLPEAGWELHLVGGGPLKNELVKMASGSSGIRFFDWQPYEALPSLYQQAGAFILPSRFEPWGLVVNEAMAAGLPVILSDQVGCAPDLLEEGKNGWLFTHSKSHELVTVLDKVAQTSAMQLSQMGTTSQGMVAPFSPATFAKNLLLLMDEHQGP